MIKFQALMQAIQESIHSASQAVEDEGRKHLDDYFDEIEHEEHDSNGNRITHRPKMVAMEFPSRTPDGIETVVANIPLITLSPISTQKITEVKFTAHLEVTTDENDEVYVAFPTNKKGGLFGKHKDETNENTKIEITLTGAEPPEGLQKVIEGYERAIRAQIPG
ncbi:DUF2589 domain-containing protein [Flocculibacter collagenilyticus]|uniref:DUF2589 domain-containing protein n=1 Tax=Flocculibacter collagenilyticus TaxID=2744479 RepID=UPI0018F78ADA|nr:DUF2589 domain-containing protein [Flocculibacter collagenilyticus]